MITDCIRDQRKRLGYSQGRLAQLAGVSLPTIQNIESGRANPCLQVLSEVVRALGLSIALSTRRADWDYLSACGVPITSAQKAEPVTATRFTEELTCALVQAIEEKLDERARLALGATFLALKTHYPSRFKIFSNSLMVKELVAMRDPRILKLRRLALSGIARFL